MKLIKLLIVGILILTVTSVSAQISENHIGFRGGIHSGIYYQNLVSAGTAEISFFAMLSANSSSVRVTAMRLVYETSLSEISDNLFFTWGYGAHIGFSVADHTYFLGRRYQFPNESFKPLIGVDGWGGLEYRFIEIPLTVGLNAKPFLELMVPGFINIQPGDIGLSFAYIF